MRSGKTVVNERVTSNAPYVTSVNGWGGIEAFKGSEILEVVSFGRFEVGLRHPFQVVSNSFIGDVRFLNTHPLFYGIQCFSSGLEYLPCFCGGIMKIPSTAILCKSPKTAEETTTT